MAIFGGRSETNKAFGVEVQTLRVCVLMIVRIVGLLLREDACPWKQQSESVGRIKFDGMDDRDEMRFLR